MLYINSRAESEKWPRVLHLFIVLFAHFLHKIVIIHFHFWFRNDNLSVRAHIVILFFEQKAYLPKRTNERQQQSNRIIHYNRTQLFMRRKFYESILCIFLNTFQAFQIICNLIVGCVLLPFCMHECV